MKKGLMKRVLILAVGLFLISLMILNSSAKEQVNAAKSIISLNGEDPSCSLDGENITNTDWTGWENISCLTNNIMNQSRSRVQYDSNNCGTFENQTFFEYRAEQSCNYCSSDLHGPIYTNWSLCNITNRRTRSVYFTDPNYESCCLVTNLSSDCSIQNPVYQNKTENQTCNYCSYILTYTAWTNWQDQASCANDSVTQNRSRVQYDSNYNNCYMVTNLSSDLWNNGINKTFWATRTVGYDCCKPNLVHIIPSCGIDDTITAWYNDTNQCFEKTGMASDKVPANETSSCNYCEQNISEKLYTSWSECSKSFTKERTSYYIDYNYDNCCMVTGLDSDCEIRTDYKDEIESVPCNLSIESLLKGVYDKSSILFEVFSKEKMTKLQYSEPKISQRFTSLCTNCNYYNKSKIFGEGWHYLILMANFSNNSAEQFNISFLIDSKKPGISTTLPKNKAYTNGSDFFIKYSEDNLKNITLFYGTDTVSRSDCLSGKNQECYFNIDLGSYNNSINYSFEIRDIANNLGKSKNIPVKADTSTPVISNLKSWISGRYAYFNMTILNEDKNSFDSVQYIDNSQKRPKWKMLCSSLKSDICYKKISFGSGLHDLTIKSLDNAGNSDEKSAIITI